MIRLEHIEKAYQKGKKQECQVLRDVSFTIEDGEMAAVVGTSGAGKSTLLHILGCIDTWDQGAYYLDEKLVDDFSEKALSVLRNEKIGMVMQDFALIEDFTALENVIIPLDFAGRGKKLRRAERRSHAVDALKAVGMEEYAHKTVRNLSGGQKQRVAIARGIVNAPSILLADEPTGALDSQTTKEIMQVFCKLNEQGTTILIVTHDEKVAQCCGRIIRIEDGRICKKSC